MKWVSRVKPDEAGRILKSGPPVDDPVVQRSFGQNGNAPVGPGMPAPVKNFAGMSNLDGVYPPDTNGDVGPSHYVQWVNLHFQIFDKSGASVYGPAAGNTLWTGFGAPCETSNAGDPIVLYDSMADRWVMSQFTAAAPYGECVAISVNGDPTGAYYRYFFSFSSAQFYDYPKLGVWPDGYYLSDNRFNSAGTIYLGASAIVLDRSRDAERPGGNLSGIPDDNRLRHFAARRPGWVQLAARRVTRFFRRDRLDCAASMAIPRRLDDARQLDV